MKFCRWLFGKDLEEYKEEKEKSRETFHPSANPADLGHGFKMLDKSIVDLNVSTSKYSRIIIVLTIVLAILTVIMFLKG